MRAEFAKTIQKFAEIDKKLIFLTGDLGYSAFENLRTSMQERFINAGVAEQNMLDVAAGMAYTGLNPWTYSIAPFLILKTVEQIRNDICIRNLPVKLVANGGGYGYGVMGATHHILEDLSILTSFPNIKLFIPAYSTDIEPIVGKMNKYNGPSYLRLGMSPLKSSSYSGFRNVQKGKKATVIVLGPLLKNVLEAKSILDQDIDVWVVTEIPFNPPIEFYKSIAYTKKVLVVEEHVLHGGLGHIITNDLIRKSIKTKFTHIFSKRYVSKLYGSQEFHLKESGLDAKGISKNLKQLLNG